ncbi:MAG TPA: hypothetical protein V6C76_05340 [Drouetiella sp.]
MAKWAKSDIENCAEMTFESQQIRSQYLTPYTVHDSYLARSLVMYLRVG